MYETQTFDSGSWHTIGVFETWTEAADLATSLSAATRTRVVAVWR